ncbi:MAG TPA: hypothetical protein VM367_08495, partial [Pseudonocardia sp.]|nr:hypothetical protein [Pseudonocardia sp.]
MPASDPARPPAVAARTRRTAVPDPAGPDDTTTGRTGTTERTGAATDPAEDAAPETRTEAATQPDRD